jgi:hypothetical protein
VEHLVKVADLEHDDVLRLRQLQLSPLVDQTARMAAFISAASICANGAAAAKFGHQELHARWTTAEGPEQQRRGCGRAQGGTRHHDIERACGVCLGFGFKYQARRLRACCRMAARIN